MVAAIREDQMLPRLPIITGLSALVLLAATTAAAQITEHKVVRHGRLDLTQDADAQVMAKRITRAALEVCGGGHGHLDVVNRAVLKSECWANAVDQAAGRLDAPKVSAALAGALRQ
ncbi:MAG: UrcA family protein [Phenylobacterium sp.]|uniref:UrcA family protein n=1 Tax=Phenylobacterium sp. TaxID=1871053 RepID=UPI003BB79AFE